MWRVVIQRRDEQCRERVLSKSHPPQRIKSQISDGFKCRTDTIKPISDQQGRGVGRLSPGWLIAWQTGGSRVEREWQRNLMAPVRIAAKLGMTLDNRWLKSQGINYMKLTTSGRLRMEVN